MVKSGLWHRCKQPSQQFGLICSQCEAPAIAQTHSDGIAARDVIQPAEAAPMNAPAFKIPGSHGANGGNVSQPDPIADQTRAETPAQFTLGNLDCQCTE